MPGDPKLERLHLPAEIRVDEDTAEKVRALASLQHRTIQQQLRLLIEIGLDQALSEATTPKAGPARRETSQDAFAVIAPGRETQPHAVAGGPKVSRDGIR